MYGIFAGQVKPKSFSTYRIVVVQEKCHPKAINRIFVVQQTLNELQSTEQFQRNLSTELFLEQFNIPLMYALNLVRHKRK